jgi:FAM32A
MKLGRRRSEQDGFCPYVISYISGRSRKKNPSKVALTGEEPIKSEALVKRIEDKGDSTRKASTGDSPSAGGSGSGTPVKTEAERRFEQAQRRRVSAFYVIVVGFTERHIPTLSYLTKSQRWQARPTRTVSRNSTASWKCSQNIMTSPR